jgi:hypothetical protein
MSSRIAARMVALIITETVFHLAGIPPRGEHGRRVR